MLVRIHVLSYNNNMVGRVEVILFSRRGHCVAVFFISKILPCLLTEGLAFFYTTIYQTWPFILLSKFDYFFYKLLALTFYKIYIIQPPGGVLIREGKKAGKIIIIIDKKLRSVLLFILIQQANEKPFIINNILAKDKKKICTHLDLKITGGGWGMLFFLLSITASSLIRMVTFFISVGL